MCGIWYMIFTGRFSARCTIQEKAKQPQLSYCPFGSGPATVLV